MLGRPARKFNLFAESIPIFAGNIECAPQPPALVAAMACATTATARDIRRNAPRLQGRKQTVDAAVVTARNQETAMRPSLFILGILAALCSAQPANADGAWCAYYNFHQGGATNCWFATFQQCLATVTGIGGSCG